MSRLADAYGLDVWIWYPAMDKDYSDPETVASAPREWDAVFRRLPRLDAVFVPGGDPGHTEPAVLMPFLARVAEVLHRSHPRATLWVSPQGFNQVWLDQFLQILRKDEPAWLTGVVHGPQVRISMADLRKAIPSRYPIRTYPDITHSQQCQFPVPDWDVAYSLTEGREVINPQAAGRGGDLPLLPARVDRLHHLFRGLQRRRQQDDLERAGLGSRRPTSASSSASTAVPS